MIDQDSATDALAFTVGDAETAVGNLMVTATSSDTALIPDANLMLGGSDANRTITVTPAAGQTGTATITVMVTDEGGLAATDTFVVTVNAVANNDFADAPTGFPVTLADDGPRHTASSLFLGASIDFELDGVNSENADSDLSDDGVFVVADPVTVPGQNTTASFSVVASEAGQLDAWFDFNGDGDWDDAGEQIATNLSLSAGSNTLSFTVPDGAVPGSHAARFRISSAGGLSPTGPADDGEVEDYVFQLAAGDSSPEIEIGSVEEDTQIRVVDGVVTVDDSSTDLFSAPVDQIGSVDIAADSTADHTFVLDISQDLQGLVLNLVGNDGVDSVSIVGGDGSVDLTSGQFSIDQIEEIDLGDENVNSLVLDPQTIVGGMNPLRASGGAGDRIELVNAPAGVVLGDATVVNGTFERTIVDSSGQVLVVLDFSLQWQNVISPSDINNDGQVTALDALTIINELGDDDFVLPGTNTLVDAATLAEFPNIYYDQSGDGQLTALDALRVINALGQSSASGEGVSGEGESVFLSDIISQDGFQAGLFHEDETLSSLDQAITDVASELASAADPTQSTDALNLSDVELVRSQSDSTDATDRLLSENADLDDWFATNAF